jgi:2,3-bisphosphoglycerate-independent phosphoglycerate mutase
LVDADATLQIKQGRLADLAPSILHMMGLTKPAEMNGENLIH